MQNFSVKNLINIYNLTHQCVGCVKKGKKMFNNNQFTIPPVPHIGVYLNHEFARLPQKAHPTDSGYDLSSCEHITIPPKQWKVVHTGLHFKIPEDHEIQIRPRSGLAAKKGITVLNAPGTVDFSYSGEIMVILYNAGEYPFDIHPGDRIAQAVLAPVIASEIETLQELPTNNSRGEKGIGSTGI